MAWNILIFIVILMFIYAEGETVSKQSKSTRGCFAELKCGGKIK
jgi:hypothetical protein